MTNERLYNGVKADSGKRDLWMNDRHREFGPGIAMTDLDFVALEHDYGTPFALIEYKHCSETYVVKPNSFNVLAQVNLANASKIPHWIVVYYPEHFQYYVIPTNEYAKNFMSDKTDMCSTARFWSERNFVKLHYAVRNNKKISDGLLDKFSNKINKECPIPQIDWNSKY